MTETLATSQGARRKDAAVVQFRVLGSLEARRGDSTVEIGSRRQRTLLAALLADAGKVVPLDALAEALWGDEPPADPRNAIQTYVARLREALGPQAPLVTRAPGYALDVDPSRVDALRFEHLLTAAQRSTQPAAACELLDEALGLWRGPAYAEFADGVARTEALRLTERRLVAVEERAAARLALGEAADLVGDLQALVSEHPLRERFVALHMRALAAVERLPEALAVFRSYRDRLAEDTGLEPSTAIRELEEQLLRGEPPHPAPRAASSGVGLRTPVGRGPSPVPVMPTSLVGREHEIAAACAALDAHRVVTLTGTGGVGKTRVAAAVATAVHREQDDEVAWVDLTSVTDADAVEHVMAIAIGADLAGGQPPRVALLGTLISRRLLLVVDNCEQLLDTVASLVDAVQRHCPQVRVLATSRERLAVDGERILAVAPLAVPGDPDGDDTAAAAQLFLERAGQAGADLSAQLPTVAAICRQLDGLPLAIELAAARTGALSPDDLLAALHDDTTAASGRRRSGAARHRDLWAVVDWSYRLLDDVEQRLFERLGVFSGTFGIDEAHAVCAPERQTRAATLQQLASLAEQSLLTSPLLTPAGRSSRYRMLRPVRAFARQRLADRGDAGTIADRHAAVLTDRTERAAGPPLTDEGRRWLEVALDDLREVRRRARLTGDVALLGRLIAALYRFDYWRPGAELIGWADDALMGTDGLDEQPTAPQVHAAGAAAAWMKGALQRAGRLATRGTQLGAGPDDPARTLAFEALGDVMSFEGRLADAEAAFCEEARLAKIGGDPDSEVVALASAALVVAYAGRMDEGSAGADAAADAAAGAGPAARAFARYAQGECRADTAPDEAVSLVEEAAELARDCGAWFVEGIARLTAASLRGRHGDPAQALPVFADLIHRWRRSGNSTQQWTTLRNLAELLVRLQADESAVVIASAADAERTAAPTFGMESDRLARALAEARTRLGAERFDAAGARGRHLRQDDVVDLALEAVGDLTHP